MQCCDPRLMSLKSDDTGYVYFVFVPCGKCYGCRCTSRAEWAVRMRYELSDVRNKSAFFVTLTYDDEHLFYHNESYKHIVNYQSILPYAERRYDMALLYKPHVSKFLRDIRDYLRIKYDRKDILLRYYLTGEYGDISNRPHYHSIIIFPLNLHKVDIQNLCRQFWQYGNFYVGDTMSAAACNYVAKHQVKDCLGSEFQQNFSPIFALQSIFNGGIGRLITEDREIYEKWLLSKIYEDYSAYVEQIQGHLIYKVAIPRFATRKWHPQKLNDDELTFLQKKSLKNLKKFICNNLHVSEKEINLQSENFKFSPYELSKVAQFQNTRNLYELASALYNIAQPLRVQDDERKRLYQMKHKMSKIKLLVTDQINYQHY